MAEKVRLILPDMLQSRDYAPTQVLRMMLEATSSFAAEISDQGHKFSFENARIELR